MAVQTLLSRLRHNGLRSLCAVRRVNASGIWASLRESALLQRAEDFHSPSPSAALNHSLQLGNQCGAAHSKLFCTSTAEGYGFKTDLLIGDVVRDEIFAEAGENIEGSLVCLAVRRGGETLTLLPGTIIRSDGIVATSASRLYAFKSKELKTTIDVKVLDTKATYEGVLLDADICSNVAFIKIMSPEQQEVARFGKLKSQRVLMSVAVGCTAESHCGLPYANSRYCMSSICSVANEIENEQSDARTSRQVINAKVDEIVSVVGGPLVDTYLGVVGVIHYQDGCQIKATPIDDVFKCLERFEKQQAHSEHEAFLNKKIEMYDEMTLVVGKDMATGQFTKSFDDIEEETVAESDSIDFGVAEVSKGKCTTSSSEAPTQARPHRKRSRDEDEGYDKLSAQIGEVALAIKKLSDDRLDVKDLYAEVMKTEGFDELTLALAFDHLVENEKVAKAFMVKSARLRRAWLEGFFNMNA